MRTKTTGIYTITCDDGRVYVGSTSNLEMRWANHRHQMKLGIHANPRMQAAYCEHGSAAFAYKLLCECEAWQMHDLERAFIATMQPAFNMTDGGRRGYTFSKESRGRMSAAKKRADLRARKGK